MARKRLGKAERAAKRARYAANAENAGLVSMDISADYGPSCMANLAMFRPGAKKWGHDTRKGAEHVRERKRIGAALRRIDKAHAKA